MGSFIPQGLNTSTGQYGVNIDPVTGLPLAAVVEVLNVLPSTTDAANFSGRTIYVPSASALYVFNKNINNWLVLNGTSVIIGAVNGSPPTTPTPSAGQLYFDTDTQVVFLWNGVIWLAIGGALAAAIKTQVYTSGGTVFALGQTQPISNDYVELFLDGIRQTPSSDYNITGNTLITTSTVPVGVTVLIRVMQTAPLVQNSQVYSTSVVVNYPTTPNTTFPLSAVGVDPASVLVFVNGSLKTLSTDYSIVSQNTSIISILQIGTSGTSIIFRATTSVPHGLINGNQTMIVGGITPFNNNVVTITNVSSSVTFDFILSTMVTSATPSPALYFYPPTQSDAIVFTSALSNGNKFIAKYFKSVVPGGNVGEINILQSTGSGISLNAGKTGASLLVKSLVQGTNVSLIDSGTSIQINAELNSGYLNRVGINVNYYTPSSNTDYVGVANTTSQVIIDLSSIITGSPVSSGRTLTIKDESGGAGTNNIVINFGANVHLDGLSSYSITQNYGYVKLITDGYNWFKIGDGN